MTYKDVSFEAIQLTRESLCEGCEGIESGSPCGLEDKCDGFKEEAVKIQEEMEEK